MEGGDRVIVFHPTYSILVSCSDDASIKVWGGMEGGDRVRMRDGRG